MQHRFFPVDQKSVLLLVVFNHPVDVHHVLDLAELCLQLFRDPHLLPVIRAIYFSHEGRKHGRPWWNFHYLDICAELPPDALQFGTEHLGNIMALLRTLTLVGQIDMYVRHV